jgi:hypothetical protein
MLTLCTLVILHIADCYLKFCLTLDEEFCVTYMACRMHWLDPFIILLWPLICVEVNGNSGRSEGRKLWALPEAEGKGAAVEVV